MTIETILSRLDTLPPMPAVAVRLLNAAQDPDVDLARVAEWIERDPAMTANVLRACNAPIYGLRTRVTSVRQATSLLGLRKIVQIALTVLASRYLTPAQDGYALAAGELWRSSVTAALAAELLAERARYPSPGTAYTAGLLQDIGKIVLAEFVAPAVAEIRRLVDDEGMGWQEAEARVVGLPHPEVGARLLERWGFPEALVESVRCHHDPARATVDPALAQLSHLADAFTMALGQGLGADGLAYPLDEPSLALARITTPRDAEEVLAELHDRVRAAEDLFTLS
ncbi:MULTISPECIES: HDOD domain-containing protein [Deferrisoma]